MGKRNVTKRSLRNGDSKLLKRPQRSVQSKIVDDAVGLSRREEQELNKALYASLQDNRRARSMPDLTSISGSNNSRVLENIQSSQFHKSGKSKLKLPIIKSSRHSTGIHNPVKLSVKRNNFKSSNSPAKRIVKRAASQRQNSKVLPHKRRRHSHEPQSMNGDDSSQSSSSSANESRSFFDRKIHAQRKFAQGCSLPGTPTSTPAKSLNTPLKLLSSRIPKTEDFLTFLCLRGTPLLPAHLDFFKFSRDEWPAREIISRQATLSGSKGKRPRESTPDSSSSNGANEEIAEAAQVATPPPLSLSSSLLSSRSAARASAGTPETARGIRSLRQGQRNSGTATPVSARSDGSRSANSRGESSVSRGQVNSVRKSLLSKLTSVARQQAKKIVNRSTQIAGRFTTRSGLQRKPFSKPQVHKIRLKVVNTRRSKKEVETDDSEDEGDETEKEEEDNTSKDHRQTKKSVTKIKDKSSRRVSSRIKDASQSVVSRSQRRRRFSAITIDYVSGEVVTKRSRTSKTDDTEKEKEDDTSRKRSKFKKTLLTKKREAAKPIRRYKIRPIERVRTRGYNILLSKKLGQKRNYQDNATFKRIKDVLDKNKETADIASKKLNYSFVQDKDSKVKTLVKLTKLSDRRLSRVSNASSIEEDDDKKCKTESGSKSRRISTSSPGRKTPPKKSKPPPSPPPPTEATTVPVFRPSEAEFTNPIQYIHKIQPLAEPFGMCKIIPPASWKLDSNKINEDIRFNSQVQHIHRLCQRWGPSAQHSAAINQHLTSQLTHTSSAPQIGGVEIDLPQLYTLVEEAGGLSKMDDRKCWGRIADAMDLPKQAMDRSLRLYDIYVRHILPYATLTPGEQDGLADQVKVMHESQPDEDDAITRGKSMSVNWFNRIARNVQSMWFKEDPTPDQVEAKYWQIIEERDRHVAVQCGHINTHAQASGFPTRKDAAYSSHPWNLNKLPWMEGCVLHHLGPVAGATIPTLHVDMLYSTSCWSSQPHALPYTQYLHTGADIVWYCIPKSQRGKFRSAMMETSPSLLVNKPKWLKEDSVMVNPSVLRDKNVKVERCVHSAREFVVVFSGAFTATISCGLSVSESVHFASHKWLSAGVEAAHALTRSGEKELFSTCGLLVSLTLDPAVDADTLTEALPLLSTAVYKELDMRTQLLAAGMPGEQRGVFGTGVPGGSASGSKKRSFVTEEDKVCQVCGRICYLSMVLNEQENQVLCLDHGLKNIQKKKSAKSMHLYVRHSQSDLEILLKQGRDKLTALTSTDARQGKDKLSSTAISDSPTGSSKTRATAKHC